VRDLQALSSGTVAGSTYKWYEFDVTRFLQSQKTAGATSVTLVVRSVTQTTPYVIFNSGEASANRPELVVSPAAAPAPAPSNSAAALLETDTYARDGSFANTSFAGSGQLQVKRGDSGWNRESFLRFDLSNVSAGVTSAKLRLFGRLDNTLEAKVGFEVYASANNDWDAAGVTFNARPAAAGPALAAGAVVGKAGTWYELDLTSFVKAQKAAG
jgi:hypothetical protein